MRAAALGSGAAVVLGWPWAAPRYFVFLASLIAINARFRHPSCPCRSRSSRPGS